MWFLPKDYSFMAEKGIGFVSQSRAKRWRSDNDWISQLPDDILLAILSLISLKEAACTSVLSSRWIDLWRRTPRLIFDADSASKKITGQHWICSRERREYVKWVNCIIRSHEGVTLEEFRICFDLRASAKTAIPQWIRFAFGRHVQRLELDFSPMGDFCARSKRWVFPEELLPSIRTGIDFKFLRVLHLKYVDVTSEAVEFFLRNCPLLEELAVCDTNNISNIEVCGPSLVLKHLEFECCHKLKSIKVSAPNLTVLIVPRVEGLLLENVPKLVEVSFKEIYNRNSAKKLLPALSCCIFQLEILRLKLTAKPETGFTLIKFPEIPKLKKLVIKYWVENDGSLMGLTSLIRASPNLQEFVIELTRWGRLFSELYREVKNTIKFHHHHLKVFKFINYDGLPSDVELIRYILENCVVIEKIIIDPRYPSYYHIPENANYLNEKQALRDKMKQGIEAQVQIPQHIELIFINSTP